MILGFLFQPDNRLRKEFHLSLLFRSIKRYFLLDQGDFFTHFMDISLEELQKRVCGISKINENEYTEIETDPS